MVTYGVRIYHYPSRLVLIPSKRVDKSLNYSPSKELGIRIDDMWRHRNPREVGLVSEIIAIEVISGGQMRIGKRQWPLSCQSFNSFADSNKMLLIPTFGMRSDDIIAVATTDRERLIFVTESKGTTRRVGFPHVVEAKIFYQLPRTVERLNAELARTKIKNLSFGGAISFQVNHYTKAITINVLDSSSSLATTPPDPWMYKDRSGALE
ncbi:hypothetical protein MUP01_10095 [Candidatus Bathyarchaeota archaeon]|nr:hypothetical protein [Candidatus Bathyarchaeota archaeon]